MSFDGDAAVSFVLVVDYGQSDYSAEVLRNQKTISVQIELELNQWVAVKDDQSRCGLIDLYQLSSSSAMPRSTSRGPTPGGVVRRSLIRSVSAWWSRLGRNWTMSAQIAVGRVVSGVRTGLKNIGLWWNVSRLGL